MTDQPDEDLDDQDAEPTTMAPPGGSPTDPEVIQTARDEESHSDS